jgi:hypothetical protein
MSTPHIQLQEFGSYWTVTCYGNDGRIKHFANRPSERDALREAELLARIYKLPARALVRGRRREFVREW